jgi:hypothetical protein
MRLIDADALGLDINRKANENFPANRNLTLYAESLLAHAPTIDAVPVVHGRWVDCENYNDIEQCSVCGMIYRYPSFYKYNYCPNCGAKMDGGDGNG